MNNRLVSKRKAYNHIIDNFPLLTEEDTVRYFKIGFSLKSQLMKRKIIQVAFKCKNKPKYLKKLDNMIFYYKEFIFGYIDKLNDCIDDLQRNDEDDE